MGEVVTVVVNDVVAVEVFVLVPESESVVESVLVKVDVLERLIVVVTVLVKVDVCELLIVVVAEDEAVMVAEVVPVEDAVDVSVLVMENVALEDTLVVAVELIEDVAEADRDEVCVDVCVVNPHDTSVPSSCALIKRFVPLANRCFRASSPTLTKRLLEVQSNSNVVNSIVLRRAVKEAAVCLHAAGDSDKRLYFVEAPPKASHVNGEVAP